MIISLLLLFKSLEIVLVFAVYDDGSILFVLLCMFGQYVYSFILPVGQFTLEEYTFCLYCMCVYWLNKCYINKTYSSYSLKETQERSEK